VKAASALWGLGSSPDSSNLIPRTADLTLRSGELPLLRSHPLVRARHGRVRVVAARAIWPPPIRQTWPSPVRLMWPWPVRQTW